MSARKPSTFGAGSDRRSIVADNILAGQNQAMKQMEQIRIIQEENDTLKKDIAGLAGANYDYVKADKLAVLQGEVDALERRYQFEKIRKNDLVKRFQLARIDLLHSRKMKGGVNVEKEHADAVSRQVTILEGRLDQALCKFNDALSYNKELRDQIDIIRGERRVFQRVHKKLDEDLRAKKRIMAERLEQSNKDMDERDEYLRLVEQFKQQIAEQEAEYRDQVRQLDVAMVEIKIMRDEQTSMQLELEGREYELEMRLADEEAMRNMEPRQIGTPQNKNIVGRRTQEESDEEEGADSAANALSVDKEVFTITDIMTQIRDATQEESPDVLREEYRHLGDSNFSLYKKINELTTTRESLSDDIRDLQLLIQEDSEAEAHQRRLIKDLEEKLASTEGQLEAIRQTVARQRDSLAIALGTTEDVYTRIGCDKLESHNPQETCTESNLLAFLGSIEERATQILLAFQRHHRMEVRRMELMAERGGALTMDGLSSGPMGAPVEDEDGQLIMQPPREVSPISMLDPDLRVPPILPVVPSTEHNAVNAQKIVRQTGLPNAHLGAENHSLMADLAEDKVVSHDEIRKQMELRLISKRDREERAARRRREKEAAATAGTSPTRKRRDDR
eukprot:gene2099-1278_t